MGQALGTVLPLAVAIAIFPVPIIAIVLFVGSAGGRAKGVAFVVAWCLGLTAVGAVVLLVAGETEANDDGDPATWVSVLLIGLGVLLIAAAARQWSGRPGAGEESPTPVWMRTVDAFTATKAGAAGFALTALNPKNIALTVAAAAEIAQFGLPADQQIGVLVVFVLVASIGVLTPLVVSLALGEGSREPLTRLRGWLARHNSVIMAVLFVVIGAKLIGDAITGFS